MSALVRIETGFSTMSEVFDTILIVVHIMLVVTLIVLVLLQKSEGGALGIGGGGGGGGFMSSRGAANALTKTTTIVAAAFFATSILLGVSAKTGTGADAIIDRAQQNQSTGVPTDAGEPENGGNLLENLQREGLGTTPSTGVPTGN